MFEIIGIVGSLLGILAFFAVAPKDLVANLKSWFLGPFEFLSVRKKKINIKELLDAFEAEDIRPENIFVSTPMKVDNFDSVLREYTVKLPDEIELLKQKEISERERASEESGVTFDNNSSYSLRRIDVSRPEGADGKRNNIYKLIVEPTDYYSFVFPNLCLDKSYYNENIQENQVLRDMMSLDKKSLSTSTLTNFPNCQFKIGTGTLLVTKDNYLVCSVRSKSQFVASKQSNDELAVHLSAAEGMYRSVNNPSSGDLISEGKPSPFVTCARSLKDELNLTEEHFDIQDIWCLGYFMDLKRAQPFFLFLLEIDLTVEEFFSVYSNTSMDFHENEAVFALPKKIDSFKALLTGASFFELGAKYPPIYDDFFKRNYSVKTRVASNHAKAGFVTYAFKYLGHISKSMI